MSSVRNRQGPPPVARPARSQPTAQAPLSDPFRPVEVRRAEACLAAALATACRLCQDPDVLAVLGATGRTGSLVAEVAAARGLDVLLIGRNEVLAAAPARRAPRARD